MHCHKSEDSVASVKEETKANILPTMESQRPAVEPRRLVKLDEKKLAFVRTKLPSYIRTGDVDNMQKILAKIDIETLID